MREPDAPADPADPADPAKPEPRTRASSEIATDVEHDLMNALASIVGFSQVIRRDPSLPDDLRHSADLLIEEATRTRRLVNDLLVIARERAESPPVDAAPTVKKPGNSPPGTTSVMGPRVLVLENDPSMRVFLEKALAAVGYDAVLTDRGDQAVQVATTDEYVAVLCDQQMPGMSGVEAYEAIVAARPDLAGRFVMMSGDLHDSALATFAAAHPVTLLAKPFDLDTLDRTLRAVMEAPDQSRG